MAQIFYDANEKDSFHLIEDNAIFKAERELTKLANHLEKKATALKTKAQKIEATSRAKLKKQFDELTAMIKDLKMQAAKKVDITKAKFNQLATQGNKKLSKLNADIKK